MAVVDAKCESGDALPEEKEPPPDAPVFVAFARVFSGTLRKGQELYVLGPKHDPDTSVTEVPKGTTLKV